MKITTTIILIAILFLLGGAVWFGWNQWNHDEVKQGSYTISQLMNDGSWKEIHRKSFAVNYNSYSFPIQKEGNTLTLRINQEHLPFGDIEQVALTACGEVISPEYAKRVSSSESVLEDILYDDHNVIVSHEDPIELSWLLSESCNDTELTLKANEYNATDEYHFSFPSRNSTESYQFQESGSITIDGTLEETDGTQEPSFTPHWYPASGHPDGPVYFYLNDDEKNVYISADITIDNSNEIGPDWFQATVYNTREGEAEKTFRITDADDTYGKCGFGETSKVSYRHQTCELAIPKTEIDGNQMDFSIEYYGTAVGLAININSITPATIYPYTEVTISGDVGTPNDSISFVDFNVSGADPGSCDADDGSFDEDYEEFSCIVVPNPFSVGSAGVYIGAEDDMGVPGSSFDSFEVLDDTTAPLINLTEPIPSVVTTSTPTFSGTLLDEEGSPIDTIHGEYSFTGVGGSSLSAAATNGDLECTPNDGVLNEAQEDFTCTFNPEALAGNYEITMYGEDVFSNTSTDEGYRVIEQTQIVLETEATPTPTPTPTPTTTLSPTPIPTPTSTPTSTPEVTTLAETGPISKSGYLFSGLLTIGLLIIGTILHVLKRKPKV